MYSYPVEPCDICHVPTLVTVLNIPSDYEGLRTCAGCEAGLVSGKILNPEESHLNNVNEFMRELES